MRHALGSLPEGRDTETNAVRVTGKRPGGGQAWGRHWALSRSLGHLLNEELGMLWGHCVALNGERLNGLPSAPRGLGGFSRLLCLPLI